MIQFYKCEALGNDFILIDQCFGSSKLGNFSSEQIQAWCNRQNGIGADGILLLKKSSRAECLLEIINSDGSYATMCGNGLRCVALWLYKKGFAAAIGSIEIANKSYSYHVYDSNRIAITLPNIEFSAKLHSICLPSFPKNPIQVHEVHVGNRHLVIDTSSLTFWKNPEDDLAHLQVIAEYLQSSSVFSDCNIGFLRLIPDGKLDLIVCERGVGFTKACGSGACAAALMYTLVQKKLKMDLSIRMPGGELEIKVQQELSSPSLCSLRMIASAQVDALVRELRG